MIAAPYPAQPEGHAVWPFPRSLATTYGISVDVFSSPYLDVSVQAVPRVRLFYSTHADTVLPCRVAPFGNPRFIAYVQLPAAYRSLSRPSSAPDAKAFPLRSFWLDLVGADCAMSRIPPEGDMLAPSPLLSARNRWIARGITGVSDYTPSALTFGQLWSLSFWFSIF